MKLSHSRLLILCLIMLSITMFSTTTLADGYEHKILFGMNSRDYSSSSLISGQSYGVYLKEIKIGNPAHEGHAIKGLTNIFDEITIGFECTNGEYQTSGWWLLSTDDKYALFNSLSLLRISSRFDKRFNPKIDRRKEILYGLTVGANFYLNGKTNTSLTGFDLGGHVSKKGALLNMFAFELHFEMLYAIIFKADIDGAEGSLGNRMSGMEYSVGLTLGAF